MLRVARQFIHERVSKLAVLGPARLPPCRKVKTAAHGVTKLDPLDANFPPRGGALKSRVRIRREDAGETKEGTPELYFTDPDGIVVQLQDTRYCGGAGYLGVVCRP